MPYELVVPHSDGAGYVSKVGTNIDKNWIGNKVLCFGAQSYRQFGTAAEFCTVPISNVVKLPDNIDLKQAAQMGIPGITAYHSIHPGNNQILDRKGELLLIQGGSGAVGQCAIAVGIGSGATVLATVRREEEIKTALAAGAHEVYLLNNSIVDSILRDYPEGIDHIVEVAFAANIEMDTSLIKQRGSIATFATNQNPASIPFWELVFKNVSIHFLGSDDFTADSKLNAAKGLVKLLGNGWKGLEIGEVYSLNEVAEAHLHIESRKKGRALVKVKG